MSDTQVLLSKIAAVRERLEKAQARGASTVGLEGNGPPLLSALVATVPALEEPERVRSLKESVGKVARHGALLDGVVRQLSDGPEASSPTLRLPRQLTPCARQLLERGRGLLAQLRTIDAELGPTEEHYLDDREPLAEWHRDTVAVVDAVLHLVQAFPDTSSEQIRLCDGLEVILSGVSRRIAILTQTLEKRRREMSRLDMLADLLTCLEAGQPVDLKPFSQLAESILSEARQSAPIRFHYPFDMQGPRTPSDHGGQAADLSALESAPVGLDAHWLARFVACHSLIVAQMAARIIDTPADARRDVNDWRGPPFEPVIAALIHDCGMLRVPVAILAQPGPLSAEQKRIVEDHASTGAELAARLPGSPAWLVEAALDHHQRLDGSGYPAGKKERDIGPLSRLLAVCDVYAAMAAPRPYRPARDTRTALTDTLLLAEQGTLDRRQAERLLQLSFYPVGSIVELADGAVGVIVAGPNCQRDLDSPARPVIALLTDSRGQPLATAKHLDLSRSTGRSIVRSLSPAERKSILGKHHPELL
jgi:HD-GYP domain-containing protein (c-di-GMP phosphodiesterase class II)